MIGYIVVFICLVVFSYLCTQKGRRKGALIVLGLLLFFVYMDLNMYKIHDVSLYMDSFNYYKNYSLSQLNQIDTYEEQGYVALNILFSRISSNFRVFYLFYAIVVITAYITLIKRYSTHTWFSGMLLLGSYFLPLFVMRQFFAIALCIFAIPFALNRKPIQFFVLVLFAFLFHRSAIVFSICYLIPYLKINYKTLFLITAVGVLAALSINIFNELFTTAVAGAELASHYMAYVTDDAQNSWKSAAVAVADLLFAFLCYRGHFKELNAKQSFFFFMCVIYTILSVIDVIGTAFTALYRILPYFGLSIIVLLPDAAGYIKSKGIRNISTLTIVLLYFVWWYSTASPWFFFVY